MTEVRDMCAKCGEHEAMGDNPRLCAECFLAFVGLLGAVTRRRLEREAADGNSAGGAK